MSLETKIKLSYKNEKLMKKGFGRQRGRDIAIARKILKIVKEKYELRDR